MRPRRRKTPPAFDRGRCRTRLDAGIDALGVNVETSARERLLDYVDALAAWNATHNLTAVRDPQAMITRHLLDCLAIADTVVGAHVVDVGTGPGLPGLVLASLRPTSAVTLIEANHKKVAFLRHARRTLALDNVTIRPGRVEAQTLDVLGDWVVTRAFASTADTIALAGHLVAPGGRLGLMKGRDPGDEWADLADGFVLEAVHDLQVPGLDAERRLVVVKRTDAAAERDRLDTGQSPDSAPSPWEQS